MVEAISVGFAHSLVPREGTAWSLEPFQMPETRTPNLESPYLWSSDSQIKCCFCNGEQGAESCDWDSGFPKEVRVEGSDGEGVGIWLFDLGVRAWGCLECVFWGLALLSLLYHLILQIFKFASWFHSRKCNHQSVACCLSLINCMSSLVSLTVGLESYSIVIK